MQQRLLANTTLARRAFNLWPCFRGTGARVRHIERDWSEVRVELPFGLRTRNFVGTMFGGSMFAAVDPFLMIMLMYRLGDAYVVWDKAATIRFLKPVRSDVHITFRIDDDEVAAVIGAVAEAGGRIDRTYEVELIDGSGERCAVVEKTIYVATAAVHAARKRERATERVAHALQEVIPTPGRARPRPASTRVADVAPTVVNLERRPNSVLQ